jgi:hypothetical protein
MSKLTRVLIIMITIILLSVVTTTIFSFFGIGFDVYGNYLLWFIALAIIYSILPSESGTLFSKPV